MIRDSYNGTFEQPCTIEEAIEKSYKDGYKFSFEANDLLHLIKEYKGIEEQKIFNLKNKSCYYFRINRKARIIYNEMTFTYK